MNKYEELTNEISAMIEKYGAKRFANAMMKWYGYKDLKERKGLEYIEKIINE